jgi:hypothetical protein
LSPLWVSLQVLDCHIRQLTGLHPRREAEREPQACAIYTRKSSEEGLEHEFNSLAAQCEACDTDRAVDLERIGIHSVGCQ